MATSMQKSGYRFYVYRGPGMIDYFRTEEEALAWAEEMGGRIGTVE